MAGLLQQGAPQQPQQGAGQPPQGGQPRQTPPQQPQGQPQQGDERAVNASPEEAGPQFEVLLEAMLSYVYGEGMERIARSLQQGEDVTRRMGQMIGTVMVTVHNALAQEGKTVPPNVMVRAGMEVSKAIGEMAMEMGRLQEGEDEAIEAAFMIGLGNFGKNAEGITPRQKERYAQIIGALRQGKQQAQGQQGQQPPQQGQTQRRQPQGQPQPRMMEGA